MGGWIETLNRPLIKLSTLVNAWTAVILGVVVVLMTGSADTPRESRDTAYFGALLIYAVYFCGCALRSKPYPFWSHFGHGMILIIVPYIYGFNWPFLDFGGSSGEVNFVLSGTGFACIPTGLIIMAVLKARRRESPPGMCRECGYNLYGNVSGVCPECGSRVPEQEKVTT